MAIEKSPKEEPITLREVQINNSKNPWQNNPLRQHKSDKIDEDEYRFLIILILFKRLNHHVYDINFNIKINNQITLSNLR